MALTASDSGGGNFKRVPAGAHIARCFSIIDCGTQTTNGQYGETIARKIRLGWEIFGEDENNEPLTIEYDGQVMPMTISKTYTLSLGEKANLRKDLTAWRGKEFTKEELQGFDIANVLGKHCMLNVTVSENNGKTYSNIAGISPMHKSMAKPEGVHKNLTFDLDNFDEEVFNGFHEKLQDYIKQSPEYKQLKGIVSASHNPADLSDIPNDLPFDDEVPF
jgi:hypothetical protein